MRSIVRAALAALLWALLHTSPAPAQTTREWSYPELVGRLIDLEALAALPARGERAWQFSSYDRTSRYDAATRKYLEWSANHDGHGILREENGQPVLAEIDGPGVIWRIWSARPKDGHVRIFLDGSATPAVDLPFKAYFDDTAAPFAGRALCHNAAMGWNSYVPIPFATSCRITAETNWGDYYHFTGMSFPPGTHVPTFTRDLSLADRAALDAADEILAARCGADPAGPRPGERTERHTVRVPAGGAARAFERAGPRAVTALRIRRPALGPGDDEARMLRELCLRITWDREPAPAVWSPLGDFFGMPRGGRPFRSLPVGMIGDVFYSYWYMPFAKGARLEVVNNGPGAREITVEVTHAPLARPAAELGRFHAKWHRDAYPPADAGRRAIDWTALKAGGPGRFVGLSLHVWNPRGSWWGEGDEKFFVDGEPFPSIFGTGTEDYFGYAWCSPNIFHHAFHNQPFNDGKNRGHVAVNRWQIADNVPFQTSFEGALEKYYANKRPTLYAALACWYAAPGAADPYPELAVAERTDYYSGFEPFIVNGALEGENLRIKQRTGGVTEVQDMASYDGRWSDDAHLWWRDGKPGDRLVLAFDAPGGRCTLRAQFTKAKDYGIARVSVDGRPLGEPIDFYAPKVQATGVLTLGTVDLAKGPHEFALEITGANTNAIKRHMFGLDYLLLAPSP